MARRNSLLQSLVALLTFLFYRLTLALPLPWARRLGAGLARLAYYLVPKIRRVGHANLDIAYGDTLTQTQKRAILLESVLNLGIVAAEFSRIPKLTQAEGAAWFKVKGLEYVDLSKGGVFFGGHMGNWEWLAPVSVTVGFRPVIVVRGFDNPQLDQAVDAIRRTGPIITIDKDGAMDQLLPHVAEGRMAGILADQSPRRNGVPVTFFGAPSWATVGPVLLAQRAQAPAYPVSMTRDDKGFYTLEFYPAMELQSTGRILADLAINVQRCQDAIEVIVRKHPGQWLWFHRRWRKRERLEQEWAARLQNENQPPRHETPANQGEDT